jgi:hypothetical protein
MSKIADSQMPFIESGARVIFRKALSERGLRPKKGVSKKTLVRMAAENDAPVILMCRWWLAISAHPDRPESQSDLMQEQVLMAREWWREEWSRRRR